MADDPNLILTLRAKSYRSIEMWKHLHNKPYYQPSKFDPKKTSTLRSGQKTPAISMNAFELEVRNEPMLRLTFDKPPKDPSLGFVLGSDPNVCDVFIGVADEGYSARTFVINFDNEGNVVLHNVSKNWAWVQYGSQLPSPRGRFAWILFPDIADMTVRGVNDLEFDVLIPDHGLHRQEYESRRNEMMASITEPSTMSVLGIDSHIDTRHISGQSTSTERHSYIYGEEIGRGSFSVVRIARNASTGAVYAAKLFNGRSDQKGSRISERDASSRKEQQGFLLTASLITVTEAYSRFC